MLIRLLDSRKTYKEKFPAVRSHNTAKQREELIYGIQKGVSWVTLCPHGCRNHRVCNKYSTKKSSGLAAHGSSLADFSSLKMSFVVDPVFAT
jgi:hypothetical protein